MANLNGHILLRNGRLQHVTERKIERKRRERRCKQLLDDYKPYEICVPIECT